MLGSAAAFTVMGGLVKVSSADRSTWSVVLARSVVITAVTYALARSRRVGPRVSNWPLLLWRSGTGFAAMVAYFYAISKVPLATAVTLKSMAPVVIAVLSPLVLRERVPRAVWAWTVVGFAGAVLLVGPAPQTFEPDALWALLTAFLSALAYLALRGLRATEAAEPIVFWFGAFGLVLALPGAPDLVARPPGAVEAAALVGTGVFAAAGQILMTHAYRYAPAALLSPLSYAGVLLSALLGWAAFGEGLGPVELLGAAGVVASGMGLALQAGRVDVAA